MDKKHADKTCWSCKHCKPRLGGAGFTSYFCELKPGLVVGSSNYLKGADFAEACSDWKPHPQLRYMMRGQGLEELE